MLLGWTSKGGLFWFAYSPNMTSGQHTHRPFNRLICKHHDVICMACRMDPFKARIELGGLFKVSAETYFWANITSWHYRPTLPLKFPTHLYHWPHLSQSTFHKNPSLAYCNVDTMLVLQNAEITKSTKIIIGLYLMFINVFLAPGIYSMLLFDL